MALEQKPVQLHHAVDPLHVRHGPTFLLGLAAQQGMNPPVAVSGQVGDDRLDRGEEIGVGQRRTATTTRDGPLPGREMRARDAQRRGDRAHRPSPGHELTRKGSFLGAVTRSTASRLELVLERLLAEQALQLADLLQGGPVL
jgi:hypothetical protein